MTDQDLRSFFARYQAFFMDGIRGVADMDQGIASYAAAFVEASPVGVNAGQNDEEFKKMMQRGFEYYRQIGTKDMQVREVRVTPIDQHHSIAHVAWRAIYDKGEDPDVQIDFEVHYMVQHLEGQPKIFGWVSGDEQALMKEYGII